MQRSAKEMAVFLRESGYRNHEIASALGVSVDAASRLVRGARPAVAVLHALTELYTKEVERQEGIARRINAAKGADHA